MDNKIYFEINNMLVCINDNEESINLLRHDDNYTYDFLTKAIKEGYLETFGVKRTLDVNTATLVRVPDDADVCNQSQDDHLLWSSRGKPTQQDILGIELLLKLRSSEHYNKLFNDKRTCKANIWVLIGQDMKKQGYLVGEGKEGGRRCSQKFQNLTKVYLNYLKHVHTTGAETKPKPDYFDEIHNILGAKDKITPKTIIDSFDISLESPQVESTKHDSIPEQQNRQTSTPKQTETTFASKEATPSTSKKTTDEPHSSIEATESTSRFRNTKQSVRPKSKSDELIATIKTINKENLQANICQFKVIEEVIQEQNALLKDQNQQRERFLALFAQMVKTDEKNEKENQPALSQTKEKVIVM